MSQILNKKYILPLIECFILSFPLLYITFFAIIGMYKYTFYMTDLILIILCTIGLISHFIFYSALKKKYNFEMNVLLYGVGFTSCSVMFVILILGMLHGPLREDFNLWLLYIFPFTFLYYSYAALLRNIEKKVNRITLCLMVIALIFFAALIIIEIMKYGIPFAGILLSPFGLYFAYCLIRKKCVLSLRVFAWSSFLPALITYWMFFLYSLLTTSII
jgi:hypothetical protein